MKILLVEDDSAILELLSTVFRRVGIAFDTAPDGATALKKIRTFDYSALVLDMMLPVMNGFEIVRELRTLSPRLLARTIVVTAASESTLRDFDRSEVFGLLRKPFDLDDLLSMIALCARDVAGEVLTPKRSYSLRVAR